MVTLGKSAFNWDVYKNRRTALQDLRRNCILIDTILETEDKLAYELVHSQVISAFGDKLNDYINANGHYVDSYRHFTFKRTGEDDNSAARNEKYKVVVEEQRQQVPGGLNSRWQGRVKLVSLPKLNAYTLNILVECAYSGFIRTDLTSGGIWQVLEVAEHYQMLEVIKACCAFLTKNLNISNCVHFYHVGIKHRHTLQRNAWHKIRANFKHILGANLEQQIIEGASSEGQVVGMELGADWPRPGFSGANSPGSHARAPLVAQQSNATKRPLPEPREAPEREIKSNNLATIKFEHFEPLLMHDKLNVENEESVWWAIRLWVNYAPSERLEKLASLLNCIRFPRFKTGGDFAARFIWQDPLVLASREAQQELSILDKSFRELRYAQASFGNVRDGFGLPCAANPRQVRPRVPHSILLAIGGWQQGQPTRLIESYDLNCNLWFECKKRIMSPLAYHGIEYINGLLYICGGTDGGEILNEVFTFNPILGECQQRPSMREARCYVSTGYLAEHLYAMGGHNGLQRMRSVERLLVSAAALEGETWQHVADMNVARSDASASVHKQLIYIAGGLNDIVIESSVEFYNPQDDSWTFITSMLTPRTSFTLLLYRDTLLAIGGNNGSERLSSVEQYNFQTRSWSHHSNLRHRRSTFSAALVDENKLIVVGGYNGQTPFNQVEMFDELAGCWIMRQHIRFDRSGLKVVVVNDLPNATDYSFLGSCSGASGYVGPAASTSVGAGLVTAEELELAQNQPSSRGSRSPTATAGIQQQQQALVSANHLRTRRPLLRSLSARLASAGASSANRHPQRQQQQQGEEEASNSNSAPNRNPNASQSPRSNQQNRRSR